MATSVRVVLPDDTVLRVVITEDSTADEVTTCIAQHHKAQFPPSDYSSTKRVEPTHYDLVLVRSGLVLAQKQKLQPIVQPNDIVEWRLNEELQTTEDPEIDEQAAQEASKTRNQEDNKYDLVSCAEPVDTARAVVVVSTNSRLRRKRSVHLLQPNQVQTSVMAPTSSCHERRRSSAHQRDAVLSRFLTRDFLLRGGFECLDHLLNIQALSRQLLLSVRDMYARLGANPVSDLFPIVHSLARQTCELVRDPSPPSDSVRWLYPLVCRSNQGTDLPIAMEGYVDVVEWVALWRNKRKVYACLCHGGVLHLFTSKSQCDEYIFEQAVRGDGRALEPSAELDHKRILKENTPQSTVDIVASQWSVRRGDTGQQGEHENNGKKETQEPVRHAFAFFDQAGKLKLIMDVNTKYEATQWITAIKQQIWLGQRLPVKLASVRAEIQKAEDTTGLISQIHSILGGSRLKVPLWWLHSHGDSVSGGQARVERARSLTLSQALKDARRDRFQINNVVYSGLCVDEMVGALLMEITRHAPHLCPMVSLQFTRLLLIVSSRTQGGGDILDAMRLLIVPTVDEDLSDKYCLCPLKSATADPVCIEISEVHTEAGASVAADIRIMMAYRVLSTQQIGSGSWETQEPLEEFSDSTDAAEVLSLVGVYHRRLVCSLENWSQLDGSVEISVASTGPKSEY